MAIHKAEEFLIDCLESVKIPDTTLATADIAKDIRSSAYFFHARSLVLEVIRGKIEKLGEDKNPTTVAEIVGEELWALYEKANAIYNKMLVADIDRNEWFQAAKRLGAIYKCFHKYAPTWIKLQEEHIYQKRQLKIINLAKGQYSKLVEDGLVDVYQRVEAEHQQKVNCIRQQILNMLLEARKELGIENGVPDDYLI